MDTLRTIKTFIARLAGAPLPPVASDRARRANPESRPLPASGLYGAADPPERQRTARQRAGDEGEAFARRYLERAGLTFVAGQVAYRDGEIDLVMRDAGKRRAVERDGAGRSPQGATLVFVEVRRRAHGSHGGAAGSITREKRRRVVAAASHYLVGLGLRSLPPCRFDVLTLEGDPLRGFAIEWIRDAFRDDG